MRPDTPSTSDRSASAGQVLRAARLALAIPAIAFGTLACGEDDPGASVVARVGEHEITVEETADYMKRAARPATREAVREAVDEMIDIELLRQRARAGHDLSPAESLQIREMEEIALINQYREDVVWASVEVDEAELRKWYDENVSEEARAQHILTRVAPTATEEEKAAARALADSLLGEVRGGADFAELAREHSDDPGSAQSGGMLDWFGRGQMVEPFERAVFATEPGEIVANVVESPFGFHVIRVVDRRKPSFEDVREEIEEQLAGPGRQEAEEAYVTRLMETSGVEFAEDNVDALIGIIDEDREPTAEERRLVLVRYAGGEIPLSQIYGLFELLPEANQRAIGQLDQGGMISALSSLVRQRLLMANAEREGTELDSVRQRMLDERVDALYMEAYMREVAQSRLEVPDSVARRYYDEHREFYQGRPFEEVAEQIGEVLRTQQMQTLGEPDAQRRLVASVADSQAARVEVVRHEDRYDDVLERLRQMHEEEGTEPPAGPAPAVEDAS